MFKLIITAVAVLGTYFVCSWLGLHGLTMGIIMAVMGVVTVSKLG